MLTCITCSKQRTEDEEIENGKDVARGIPHGKDDSVKNLTNQIKDMALKMCKPGPGPGPGPGPTTYKKGQCPFPEFDTLSQGAPYPYFPGSSSSTPAWDFATPRHHPIGADSRFARGYSGSGSVPQSVEVVLEEDGPKEWMAQVEPGVQITFVSLPSGGNDLKRIRFSREMFNKWQAQRWWGENYDRITELYNVQRFNRQSFQTPARSEDERISSYSRLESARESPMTSLNKEWAPRNYYKPSAHRGFIAPEPSDNGMGHHYNVGPSSYGPGGPRAERPSMDASRTTTSSRDEASVSISNASEVEAEWIEEDEPGVYITLRQLADGTSELRRVRFSRERFGENRAKTWWEENRDRIQEQYL